MVLRHIMRKQGINWKQEPLQRWTKQRVTSSTIIKNTFWHSPNETLSLTEADPPNLYLMYFRWTTVCLTKQIPQQREDSHGDELTLHLVGDARVRGQQADTQHAAKLIRDGGQAEVVAQVHAGTQQSDKSQTPTQQVVK